MYGRWKKNSGQTMHLCFQNGTFQNGQNRTLACKDVSTQTADYPMCIYLWLLIFYTSFQAEFALFICKLYVIHAVLMKQAILQNAQTELQLIQGSERSMGLSQKNITHKVLCINCVISQKTLADYILIFLLLISIIKCVL